MFFYNNEEDCPYEDQCIVLHKESPMCKFADRWERDNCLFNYKKADEGSEDEDDENDDEQWRGWK